MIFGRNHANSQLHIRNKSYFDILQQSADEIKMVCKQVKKKEQIKQFMK